MSMKITTGFLLKLKEWIVELHENDNYRLPDFMKDEEGARLLIKTYQEKLNKYQGNLANRHFTEDAEDEAITEYLPAK